MCVLFIGGTGTISLAATRLLAQRGVALTVLNRGLSGIELPEGVGQLRADVGNREAVTDAVDGLEFDVVVNWRAYAPADVEADIALFGGRTAQYVFISSATVYRKPSPFFPLVEDAPLENPDWPYAHNKILCEDVLRRARAEQGFPATIVRPSYTYGERSLPTAFEGTGWTIVDRLRRGKPVLVPGDGESLWTMTHNTDFARGFVGLLGNDAAIGESFHLTSDEVLTWNQIAETIARAVGVEPRLVHVPSDFAAAIDPEIGIELLGDKAHSLVFDNSKIKRFVPGFEPTVPFADGVARSVTWLDANPAYQVVDAARDAAVDRILEAYEAAWDGQVRSRKPWA
jgi:nucleoside-diphosphate-sugar epimerase